ncbi:TraR/DksA family transcriptional regulator [Kribbella sp. C-35]|uniref:TraR/DksA family transcriptional regulator n=1 Tax=Kribbella sp. C-35 TaxID=2789276 RepID=UPI00397813E5
MTAITFNAGLPRHELTTLRARLLEQRAFRREQLRTIRGSAPKDSLGADRSAHAQVQDHLTVAARIVLADVEAALDRMDTGHYGQCIRCRRAVEVHRLQICPQTVYCGECHRIQESGQ